MVIPAGQLEQLVSAPGLQCHESRRQSWWVRGVTCQAQMHSKAEPQWAGSHSASYHEMQIPVEVIFITLLKNWSSRQRLVCQILIRELLLHVYVILWQCPASGKRHQFEQRRICTCWLWKWVWGKCLKKKQDKGSGKRHQKWLCWKEVQLNTEETLGSVLLLCCSRW